jgi:hypothetical protein
MKGMTTVERIEDFSCLGEWLRNPEVQSELSEKAFYSNAWFTPENVKRAINGVAGWLNPDVLTDWLNSYELLNNKPISTGVVMAGNIPLAGFHDFLSVLTSGNILNAKLSAQDSVLMPLIAEELKKINPAWEARIHFCDRIGETDAVIATGSNNTARYFEYYFKDRPLLLRKNRNSAAVLTGSETESELSGIAEDVMSYFGLGCRNVSLIFMPEDYPLEKITRALFPMNHILEHHKYANSYTYQRTLLLMDLQPFTDTGFCILRESDLAGSPVSVIHYCRYKTHEEVIRWAEANKDQLQCITGKILPGTIPHGMAQYPTVKDYADHIDTISFLINIAANQFR